MPSVQVEFTIRDPGTNPRCVRRSRGQNPQTARGTRHGPRAGRWPPRGSEAEPTHRTSNVAGLRAVRLTRSTRLKTGSSLRRPVPRVLPAPTDPVVGWFVDRDPRARYRAAAAVASRSSRHALAGPARRLPCHRPRGPTPARQSCRCDGYARHGHAAVPRTSAHGAVGASGPSVGVTTRPPPVWLILRAPMPVRAIRRHRRMRGHSRLGAAMRAGS